MRGIWFPDASILYGGARLRKVENGAIRLHECVQDFREWRESNLKSAFGYSGAPSDCAAGLLHRELGNGTTRKNQLVVNGCEFKTASETVKHPNKGRTSVRPIVTHRDPSTTTRQANGKYRHRGFA